MLEAQFSSTGYSSFNTFTYEEVPANGSLRKAEISRAFHRLRTLAKREVGRSVRFFANGEYGEKFGRPHYHAAVFGLLPSESELIDRAWSSGHRDRSQDGYHGHVDHGVLTADSAAYIAGYVTSKLKQADHPELLGREPQFAVMSRNPGIGLQSFGPLLEALRSPAGQKYIREFGDVPTSFLVAGKTLPLGPYIRGVIREQLFGDHKTPQAAKDRKERLFHENVSAYLPSLRADATLDEIDLAKITAHLEAFDSYTSSLRQKALKADARHNINRSRKTL